MEKYNQVIRIMCLLAILTMLVILLLAFDAAALVEVRPDGAKLSVACFELDAAGFFLVGAFFVVELQEMMRKNSC